MAESFEIGAQREVDGQRYRCVGLKPHTRRDGTITTLAVFETDCAQCGASFETALPNTPAAKFEPSRRCHEHRRPGVYVNRARWAEVCRRGRA